MITEDAATAGKKVDTQRLRSMCRELTTLLQQQLTSARHGNLAELETFLSKADHLVRQIGRAGVLELDDFAEEKQQLEKSYRQLCLSLTDQGSRTRCELDALRKARKTLATYRINV